jgi:mannitol-1-/sugar-/sorbitol-6-/2-deoxyglucose-6-phosphatase
MSDRRALIFDMDGLMVDSEPLWWRVERAFAEAHQGAWSDELALGCVGKGLPNVIETMNATFGWTLDVNDGARQLVDRFIAAVDSLELKPGCRAILEAAVAADRKRAVASSSPHRLIDAVLTRFELTDVFHVVVSGDDVDDGKPAPDIFLLTAEKLGVTPDRCVVFEDSHAGVTAGCAAGMTVIAIPEHSPERFTELTPHVLPDLNAARPVVGL